LLDNFKGIDAGDDYGAAEGVEVEFEDARHTDREERDGATGVVVDQHARSEHVDDRALIAFGLDHAALLLRTGIHDCNLLHAVLAPELEDACSNVWAVH